MLIALLSLGSLAASPAGAQAPSANSPLTPRPAHERLTVFEGAWALEGSPAERELVETCEWMVGGRRHLVCRTRYRTTSGPQERMLIYSYRGSDSTYLAYALMPTGQTFRYAGRPDGDRWVMDLIPNAPAESRRNPTQRLRMVITPKADTIHFLEESSENGGPWTITENYRHIRVKTSGANAERRP